MECILVQLGHSKKSVVAPKLLCNKSTCLFDLTLSSNCLRPLHFNSRDNNLYENYYHLFIGKTEYGSLIITSNRMYL